MALKETDTLFDKIANKQVFISMILSGTLQKKQIHLLCIIILVNYYRIWGIMRKYMNM